MEQWEFHQLAHATVTRFLHRIPARYAGGFEAELDGGEYSTAVENLVLTLVNDSVPVAPTERDDLRRLLEYLHESSSKLDGLNVVSIG
jgi:hypothetical protein